MTPEDALIGIWEGSGGELYLNPDLSYLWRAPADAPAVPASLASQRGEWSYRNNQLRMIPLARRQVPVVEAVMMDEKKQITAMQTAHGKLEPVVDPAILAKPNEPAPNAREPIFGHTLSQEKNLDFFDLTSIPKTCFVIVPRSLERPFVLKCSFGP